jgi:hypothetical protein
MARWTPRSIAQIDPIPTPNEADATKKGELMSGRKRRYISYLLRLWQVKSEGELVWRASLESSRTGQRQGFASLEAMVTFLEQAIGHGAPDAPSAGNGGGEAQ